MEMLLVFQIISVLEKPVSLTTIRQKKLTLAGWC